MPGERVRGEYLTTYPSTTSAPIDDGDVSSVADTVARIRNSVQQVFVGKDEAIDLAIITLLSRGHLLIEDVPGTGKTTLAKTLASTMGLDFRRVQFTPDLVPSDVVGVNIFNSGTREFEFRQGPVFTQILLADEINRATPRTQSALLEAMQEQQVSVDGVTYQLNSPFFVLATLNPIEMEGTFPLPEAQLDRFMLRLTIGYPSDDEEGAMLERFREAGDSVAAVECANAAEIERARVVVESIGMEAHVRDYLLSVVRATRNNSQIRLGASPRAGLALQRASQARAASLARAYAMPDDVKALAGPVLSHRIVLEPTMQMRRRDGQRVIEDIVEGLPVPIER